MKQGVIGQDERMAASRAEHLASMVRHWQCEGCGFDLHSTLRPADLPGQRCPKCAGSCWDRVPKAPPPSMGGAFPGGRNEATHNRVRVPDPLPIVRRRRVDELALAAAGGVRETI